MMINITLCKDGEIILKKEFDNIAAAINFGRGWLKFSSKNSYKFEWV